MNPPIITIKFVRPGIELILGALAKLPYEQSAGLIKDIEAQANEQLQALQKAAAAAPSPESEQAPSASADPVPETAN